MHSFKHVEEPPERTTQGRLSVKCAQCGWKSWFLSLLLRDEGADACWLWLTSIESTSLEFSKRWVEINSIGQSPPYSKWKTIAGNLEQIQCKWRGGIKERWCLHWVCIYMKLGIRNGSPLINYVHLNKEEFYLCLFSYVKAIYFFQIFSLQECKSQMLWTKQEFHNWIILLS